MIHGLTRIFSGSKRRQDPEYVPPYFWHRYGVWRWGMAPMIVVALIDLLNLFWASRGGGWNLLLAITVAYGLYNVPHNIRRRWVARECEALNKKLESRWRRTGNDESQTGGDITKYAQLELDMNYYINHNWSSLSIRLTPWKGSGTKFTVYEKQRTKRVYTFYHS